MLSDNLDNRIWCAIMLSLLVGLFVILFFAVKCLKAKLWLREDKNNRFVTKKKRVEKEFEQSKKSLQVSAVSVFVVVCLVITIFVAVQETYAMAKEYIWSDDERGAIVGENEETLTFVPLARQYGEAWWKDAIHYGWYEKGACNDEGEFDGIIDKACLDYCQNKLVVMLTTEVKTEDKIDVSSEKDIYYIDNRMRFTDAVNSDVLDAATAWKAFKAGLCVQEYNYTSENVFQTGVLAEKSHHNVCSVKRADEMSIVYLGGLCKQWEQFLTFKELLIGAGEEISEEEVLLRLGKCFYNEARYGAQDENVKANCAIMAYVIFSYLADGMDNENRFYLLCIYYSGHSFLNIMPDIQNEEYRAQLQKKELERWDDLVINGADYELEDLELENFWSVKKGLESIV